MESTVDKILNSKVTMKKIHNLVGTGNDRQIVCEIIVDRCPICLDLEGLNGMICKQSNCFMCWKNATRNIK